MPSSRDAGQPSLSVTGAQLNDVSQMGKHLTDNGGVDMGCDTEAWT